MSEIFIEVNSETSHVERINIEDPASGLTYYFVSMEIMNHLNKKRRKLEKRLRNANQTIQRLDLKCGRLERENERLKK